MEILTYLNRLITNCLPVNFKPMKTQVFKLGKEKVRISFFIFILFFVYSCHEENDVYQENSSLPLQFSSDIRQNEIQVRASDVFWDIGDQIGVFMKSARTILSENTIVDYSSNVIYSTSSNNGLFSAQSVSQTIFYPQDNSSVDFIAYYPYQSEIFNDYIYKVDITDQTIPQNIDLLYSNNIEGASQKTPNNALIFSHQLSKLRLNIKADKSITSLNNILVEISGVKTLADFNLTDGSLLVNQESDNKISLNTSINETSVLSEAILLPDNGGDSRIISIKLPKIGTFTWKIPSTTKLEKGNKYTFNIVLDSDGIIVDPDYGWVETPLMSDLPSNQIYINHMLPDNSKIRNYSMLYDTEYKLAYWVAYPLHSSYIGSSGRTNKWAYDPSISTSWQAKLTKGYGVADIDRGHQIPSSDRTSSVEANATTFYYTNMTPQASYLNQRIWATLEDKVRSWMKTCDTLYVVTGAMLTTESDQTIDFITNNNDGLKVAKPKYYYKALAKRINNITYYTIAFKFDNKAYSSGENVQNYQMTVTELEKLTGFTFFPSVSSSDKNIINNTQWN